MHKLFFVIGASGSGKTTIIKALEKANLSGFKMFYFDNMGVPSEAEMIEKYNGPEEWQRIGTDEWVQTIKEHLNHQNVILDGQTRPSFIKEACDKNGIVHYDIILFDCSDEERKKRLKKRGQPELADQNMMNWAKYLRDQCNKLHIIDNTHLTEVETASKLINLLKT